MQLHELTSPYRKTKKKRVGRGGKRGTTSGRGTKGQKSRAGHRIRPAVRDLISRIPKRRGFRNKPTSERPLVFNVMDVIAKLTAAIGKADSFTLDRSALKQAGLIRAKSDLPVKLLGKGEIAVRLAVRGIAVSKSARAAIEKAGGTVKELKNKSANIKMTKQNIK